MLFDLIKIKRFEIQSTSKILNYGWRVGFRDDDGERERPQTTFVCFSSRTLGNRIRIHK